MSERYYDPSGLVRHRALDTEHRRLSPGSGYGTDEDRPSGSSSGEEGTWRAHGPQPPAAGQRPQQTWLDAVTKEPDAVYGSLFIDLTTIAQNPAHDGKAGLSILDDITEVVMRERICGAMAGIIPEATPQEEWDAADEEKRQEIVADWEAGLARVPKFAAFAVRLRVYQKESWPQDQIQINHTGQFMPADMDNEFLGAMFEFMMYEAMLAGAGNPTPLLLHMAGLMHWTPVTKLEMTEVAMQGVLTEHVIPGVYQMSQEVDGPSAHDTQLVTGLASVATKMIAAQFLDSPLSCVVVLRAGIEDGHGSTTAPIFDAVEAILLRCSIFLRKHLVSGRFAWNALSAADQELYCLGYNHVLGGVDMGDNGGLHERRWDGWKAMIESWSEDVPDERYGPILQAMNRAERAHPGRRQTAPQTQSATGSGQHSSSSSRGNRSSRSSRRH